MGGLFARVRYVYPERGVQRGHYGIGHVLQIISDPPPHPLLALCKEEKITG